MRNSTFRAVDFVYPRQHAWIFHAGDTWRVNDKLTLDYGLRWDYYSPSSREVRPLRRSSIRSARIPVPVAPGRLAFAGDGYGAASFGARYPEEDWYGGFAPRLGGVYSLNDKTVIRAGWGIFYAQAFYPGWGGGISLDGFSNAPTFSTTGGIDPAFFLDNGYPQTFTSRPTSDRTSTTASRSCIGLPTPTSGPTRISGTLRSIASSDTTSR